MPKATKLSLMVRLYCSVEDIEQKELAEAWGCSESSVTRFLQGQAVPTAPVMLRIFQWSLGKVGR